MTLSGTTHLSFVGRLGDRHDHTSWAEFHKYYGELLLSYARRLGASHDEAEDIAQEVEIGMFKAVEGFRHHGRKGCFRAYLRTAVVHAAGRRAAGKARQETSLDPQTFEALGGETDPCDPVWEREEYLHRVRWAVRLIAKEFEPVTLEVFRLHVLADMPAPETAGCLGISTDSVYQAKSRIFKRLKERIDSLDSDVLDL